MITTKLMLKELHIKIEKICYFQLCDYMLLQLYSIKRTNGQELESQCRGLAMCSTCEQRDEINSGDIRIQARGGNTLAL